MANFNPRELLVTGGSGLLGGELKKLLPAAVYPSSAEFNVTNLEQMRAYAARSGCKAVLHAAAFISPPRIDKDPLKAIEVNIIGTALVTRVCMELGLKLIYISTDYVFRGDGGLYKEEDTLYPVNKYAWSKLGGECSLRLYDNSLIIRTTFGPNEFPFEKAFTDQWTSRESVRAIAAKIAKAALLSNAKGVLHIGGARRTVMAYARALSPAKNIQPLTRAEVPFGVPRDTSLNTERFEKLQGEEK